MQNNHRARLLAASSVGNRNYFYRFAILFALLSCLTAPRVGEAQEPVEATAPESVADQSLAASGLTAPAIPVSGSEANLTARITELETKLEQVLSSIKPEKTEVKNDDFLTFKCTGFLQLDSAQYTQSPNNKATVGDAQNGTGFRRARFAVAGKAAEFTLYQLEVDFANAGRPSFFDNYVEQQHVPVLGDVRVGHFLQPFSVDAMTGFRSLPFLERSLPFLAFVPFRRLGAMASDQSSDEMTHWSYSVFRTGGFNNAPLGDSRFATDIGDVGGISFSTRVTQLLWYDEPANDRYLWHVGISYDYSQLGAETAAGAGLSGNAGSNTPFYQSRVLPEFGPLGYPELSQSFGNAVNGTPIFVDSGKYAASNFNLIGLETVYQAGPLSLQAEYMATIVESVVGPIFYNGAYAEVMYRLTGEHRAYDRKLAALKNPTPYTDFIPLDSRGVCGWGAWEVAARWSFVDIRNPSSLNGHYYNSATNTFTGNGNAGNGQLNDITLGMTWFLNLHTKIQLNWIHGMLDNVVHGSSTADLFVSRVQVDY